MLSKTPFISISIGVKSSTHYSSLFTLLFIVLITFDSSSFIDCRKHHLVLQNDIRRLFPISTFGYFPGGSLKITVAKFKFNPSNIDVDVASNQFGFTLAQTLNNNYSPFLEGQRSCLLNDDPNFSENYGMITFKFDFKNNRVQLNCNSRLSNLNIISDTKTRAKRDNVNVDDIPKSIESQPKQAPDNTLNGNKSQKQSVEELSNTIEQPKPKLTEQDPKHVETGNDSSKIAAKNDKSDEKPKAPTVADAPQVPKKGDEPPLINENIDLIPKETFGGEPIINIKPVQPEPKKSDSHEISIGKDNSKSSCNTDSFEMKQNDKNEYSFEFKMFVTEPHLQGLYALYFHNCLNYPGKIEEVSIYSTVDLDIWIDEQNLSNYLSAGQIPLPQLFFALSVIFFILGTIWFYSLQNRASETFKIHYLMGVLVFVKAISLLFHGINYYYIAKEGSQVETWAVLYYVTHFLKGALMFITIVLIGTGWAFVKHILSDKDKKIFMIVIPLQVIANIADIITEESEEGALIHTVWREIFIMVDMICCGAILFPVIWSIRHLQEASQTDGKAAINLKKLQLFRHFYVMIVVYIYFTRIIVYLIKITVPFDYEWLDQLFQHVATLVFFILTGYRFQPASSNPYYQLLQEEIELDEEVLFIQPSTFTEAKKRNRDLESNDMQSLIGRAGTSNSHDYD